MADFEELIDGNMEFMMNNHDYRKLAEGQHPKYIVIACSDSREVPEIITNEKLGEIFDIRVAGCVIDDAAIGSIEYGVDRLGIKNIVMLAHTRCGAVTAAQELLKNGNHDHASNNHTSSCLDMLVTNIYDKISKNPMNSLDLANAIVDNAKQQIDILTQKSEVIRNGLKNGLSIKLALYNIDNGMLKFIETEPSNNQGMHVAGSSSALYEQGSS